MLLPPNETDCRKLAKTPLVTVEPVYGNVHVANLMGALAIQSAHPEPGDVHFINVCETALPDQGAHTFLPLCLDQMTDPKHLAMRHRWLRMAVNAIDDKRKKFKHVVVNCRIGCDRSVLVVMTWLVQCCNGLTFTEDADFTQRAETAYAHLSDLKRRSAHTYKARLRFAKKGDTSESAYGWPTFCEENKQWASDMLAQALHPVDGGRLNVYMDYKTASGHQKIRRWPGYDKEPSVAERLERKRKRAQHERLERKRKRAQDERAGLA